MSYWLMKSEPDEFSISDLQRLGKARWDGVRNYQARNFLRAMAEGDEFFFYHSSCPEPGIAGIGKIVKTAYPDPTALDPDSHYHDAKHYGEKPVECHRYRVCGYLQERTGAGLSETAKPAGATASGAKRQPTVSHASHRRTMGGDPGTALTEAY